jgi:hypothetical protein
MLFAKPPPPPQHATDSDQFRSIASAHGARKATVSSSRSSCKQEPSLALPSLITASGSPVKGVHVVCCSGQWVEGLSSTTPIYLGRSIGIGSGSGNGSGGSSSSVCDSGDVSWSECEGVDGCGSCAHIRWFTALQSLRRLPQWRGMVVVWP